MPNIATRTARVQIDTDAGPFFVVIRRATVEQRAEMSEVLTALDTAAQKAKKAKRPNAPVPENILTRVRKLLGEMVGDVEDLSIDGKSVTSYAALAETAETADPVGWAALFWTLWSAAVEVSFLGSPLASASVHGRGSPPGAPGAQTATAPDAPNPDNATGPGPTPETGAP